MWEYFKTKNAYRGEARQTVYRHWVDSIPCIQCGRDNLKTFLVSSKLLEIGYKVLYQTPCVPCGSVTLEYELQDEDLFKYSWTPIYYDLVNGRFLYLVSVNPNTNQAILKMASSRERNARGKFKIIFYTWDVHIRLEEINFERVTGYLLTAGTYHKKSRVLKHLPNIEGMVDIGVLLPPLDPSRVPEWDVYRRRW